MNLKEIKSPEKVVTFGDLNIGDYFMVQGSLKHAIYIKAQEIGVNGPSHANVFNDRAFGVVIGRSEVYENNSVLLPAFAFEDNVHVVKVHVEEVKYRLD